ncbi:hypothetical protein ACHQM5_010450 [Ranunculus cassubicifolius]
MAELLQPPEIPVNGTAPPPVIPTENPSKRQRRPSVRLGEIGDQPATLSYDSYRRNKAWSDTRYRYYPSQKDHKDTGTTSGKSSKTRALTNFGNGHETLELGDKIVNGGELKGKRGGTKRVRSNWVSRVDEGGFDKFSGDEWGRDFDGERSESPMKEHSPVNSFLGNHEKDGSFLGMRRGIGDHGGVELLEGEGPSDTDGREWKSRMSVDGNGGTSGGDRGRCRSLEDGVRMWLGGLGLGRYEPIFEIHEVDEDVLPLLTLEDLKDMGINAVGSRRKLYSAIQKLGRGFS